MCVLGLEVEERKNNNKRDEKKIVSYILQIKWQQKRNILLCIIEQQMLEKNEDKMKEKLHDMIIIFWQIDDSR